jgi:hypothetical protein
MYLNITASKDTYIQNKILSNRFRTSDANVGQAGTLDLFKLYGESSLPTLEAVNQSEVVTIVLPDHDGDSENLDGLYFIVYDDADIKYYVWFDVDESGNDPAVVGATGIQISVTTTDEDGGAKETIASTLTAALDLLAPFSATNKGSGEVELTVDEPGPVKNASSGTIADSNFSINVTQQGNKAGTYNLDVDGDLVPETAVELSRIFVDFDLSILNDMSTLDSTHSDFNATLYLYDILDGQMAPTNFNVEVFPMAQSFTEGIGRDTGAFSDLDICNFVTASYSAEPILWNSAGADAKGVLGNPDLDVYCSASNDEGGFDQLYVSKNFVDGTEPFSFDVTTLVKKMLGETPDITPNGFRISFSELEEQDSKTYFLKRFASRHALNQYLRPRLCISWNDSFRDNSKNAIFDTDNTLLFQNSVRGVATHLAAEREDLTLTLSTGSYESATHTVARLTAYGDSDTEIDGMYSVIFSEDEGNLLSSTDTSIVSSQPEIVRVVLVDHDTDSENLRGYYFTIANNDAPVIYDFWFGYVDDDAPASDNTQVHVVIEEGDTGETITNTLVATINSGTSGLTATAFSLCAVHVELDDVGEPANLASTGTVPDEDFKVSRYQEGNSVTLQDHIVASGSIDFATSWADSDGVTLHTGTLTVNTPIRSAYNAIARNLTFSVLNAKPAYKTSERAKFRVFAKDHNQNLGASKLELEIDSIIFDEMYYRIRDTVSGDLIVPFENDKNGTRLSTDSNGMYFEVVMSTLFPGRAYTVDLLIVENGNEIVYECKGTRFRVDL